MCHLESVHQSFSPSVLLLGRQTDPVLSDLYQMPCLLFEEDALPKESVCKKKNYEKNSFKLSLTVVQKNIACDLTNKSFEEASTAGKIS